MYTPELLEMKMQITDQPFTKILGTQTQKENSMGQLVDLNYSQHTQKPQGSMPIVSRRKEEYPYVLKTKTLA